MDEPYSFRSDSDQHCDMLIISSSHLFTELKGQMNQKIDIFSFVALPSPNTKKNHPKWDLGKDFSSQAFVER